MCEQIKVTLTAEQLQQLKNELQMLKTYERADVEKMIKEAMRYGDLENNAEYSAAMDEKERLEARIRKMENVIGNCKVVDDKESNEQPNDGK